MALEFAFDNSYARLPDRCHARLAPTPVRAPRLLQLNAPLASQLGLNPEALATPEGLAVLAGNRVPAGAEPLAMAYAGHQFGGFVPQLGDGRAILLGELLTPAGERFDLQLKGAGRTPFSRAGDGRAWLGPVLREYLIGEAMQALGIPTTRALAAVATGETVWREEARPGAVLTRVARSHLRIGTFEYFAVRQDPDALRRLVDHALARHDPEARRAERPALALLESVIDRQAELVARWLGVGFIHGVMNTDNTSISGETLDYGPCAFLDHYRPDAVYSSIDRHGRYAYGNQPRIAHWNLASLAQALLPLIDPDPEQARELAQEAVDRFPARFEQAWLATFGAKLGLREPRPEDAGLIEDFLEGLAASGADFTDSFRALCDQAAGLDAAGSAMGRASGSGAADPFGADGTAGNVGVAARPASESGAVDPFGADGTGGPLAAWLPRWRARLAAEPDDPAARAARMRLVNPALIPRNHQVERVLEAAVAGDLEPFRALLAALADPWSERPDIAPWRTPPRPHEVVQQTFCGT